MLIAIRSLVEYFSDNYIEDEVLVREVDKMVKTLYDPEVEKRGIEKGIEKEKLQIAKNLLDILDDDTIANKTGLSIEKIRKLRKPVN